MRRILVVVCLAGGCTTIAGLDEDYVLGGSGAADAASASASVGVGGGGATPATGGAPSSASMGGSGATGGSGGGTPPDILAMIASLGTLRVELQCLNEGDPYCSSGGVVTDTAMGAGDPTATYEVDVHIRGVTEMNSYVLGASNGQLYTGGQSAGSWNIYRIDVSDPPEHYFVNSGTCCEPWCEQIDIVTTILMTGEASLALEADDRNNLTTHNEDQSGNPIVVAGVDPAPDPFNGQFIQLDVTDVRRVP